MLQIEALRDLLAGDLGNRDRLLVVLAVKVTEPKSVLTIKLMARNAGWRGVDKVNVSRDLGRVKKLAVSTAKGWELTSNGRKHVADLVGSGTGHVIATIAPALRSHLAKVTGADARDFAEEAVRCYEGHLYRAAVVLSWVGACAVLYDHVVATHLVAFNAEATRRATNPRYPWKVAVTADDLARMKEHDFLEVVAAISVLGKNVKEELQKCLKLRNACGHPNTLKLGEHMVAAHVETLILNVFSKF